MRTVLIVGGDYLLTSGVMRLLSGQLDLHVTRISGEDEDSLAKSIEQLHPDVVVVEGTLQNIGIMQVLKPRHSSSFLRLVVVNHEDNWIHVLQKQEILVQDQADLVTAILR